MPEIRTEAFLACCNLYTYLPRWFRSSDDVSDSGSDSGGEGTGKKKKKKGKTDKNRKKSADKPAARKTISAGGNFSEGSARSGARLQDRQFKDALNKVRNLV